MMVLGIMRPYQQHQVLSNEGVVVGKESMDVLVDQLVVILESDVQQSEQYSLMKENYFDTFAEMYNDTSIPASLLRDMIYERWIEKRVKLLDHLMTSWEDWAFAWDNADKKKF